MCSRSSSSRSAPEWEAVDILRPGPNPRWRCKSCLTNFTGAPRRVAQHILGVGGIGQIKPCPRPLQEYVVLMADLMVLDEASGRLVRKTTTFAYDKDGGGAEKGGGGGGGGEEITPAAKVPKRKPRSAARGSARDMSAAAATAASAAAHPCPERFEVFVAKEDFKFSSSHFVAFEGFRERLHGHNYSCGIRLRGEVCQDGYVVDFGVVKKVMRKLCKELNERFLCPMESNALEITITGSQVVIVCQDGATFVLPQGDCALLPLVHTTAEELAHFLFTRLLREFSLQYLHSRGVIEMDVSVAELPRQEATYRGRIPLSADLIQDPPFRSAKRVQGCFSGDGDNDDGCSLSFNTGRGGGGGGGHMDVSSGNMEAGVSELPAHHGSSGGGFPRHSNQNRLDQQVVFPFGVGGLGGGGGGGSGSGSWTLGGGGSAESPSPGDHPPSFGVMVGRVHLGGADADAGGSGAAGAGALTHMSGSGAGGVGGGGMTNAVESGLRPDDGMDGTAAADQGFSAHQGVGIGGGDGGVHRSGQGLPPGESHVSRGL